MTRKEKKQRKQQLKSLAAVRGLERERHFANGGSQHSWMGGVHTVTKNKRRVNSRKACRGKWL